MYPLSLRDTDDTGGTDDTDDTGGTDDDINCNVWPCCGGQGYSYVDKHMYVCGVCCMYVHAYDLMATLHFTRTCMKSIRLLIYIYIHLYVYKKISVFI